MRLMILGLGIRLGNVAAGLLLGLAGALLHLWQNRALPGARIALQVRQRPAMMHVYGFNR